MDAAAETTSLQNRHIAETVVHFSPADVKAPFALRCGALLLDYIVIIAIPVIFLLLSRYMGNDGAKLINSELNSAGWLVAMLLGITNMIILPILSGQTLGKMMTGLRIVNIDGSEASFTRLLFRQTICYLLTLASGGLGFVFSIFSSKGRALHDYIASTVVIYAVKRSR